MPPKDTISFDLKVKEWVAYVASLLAVFSFLLPKGNAQILPVQPVSSVLTQTEVVAGRHTPDLETQAFLMRAKGAFLAPGLAEGFVPQGICYDAAHGVYLISGYYPDGETPSRVCVLNKKGELQTSVAVLTPGGKRSVGHFGGIATFGNFVYIASSARFYVLPLDVLLAAPDGADVPALAMLSSFLPATSGAEVANGVLWLSQFCNRASEDTLLCTVDEDDRFYARADGYVLDANAPLGIRETQLKDSVATPDYAVAIPQNVQGMTVLRDGRFIFTASYHRDERSYVMLYRNALRRSPVQTLSLGDSDVPLYVCSLTMRITSYVAPSMLQEVCLGANGRLYFLTESGAEIYRCHGALDPMDEVLAWRAPALW